MLVEVSKAFATFFLLWRASIIEALLKALYLTQMRFAEPPPPDTSSPAGMTSEYSVGQQVEFFYNGAWHPGTIQREVRSSSGTKIYTLNDFSSGGAIHL